jgi:hypothetical protein
MISLIDFLIEDTFPRSCKHLDYEKATALNDPEFVQLYRLLMHERAVKEDWWNRSSKAPDCSECGGRIQSLEELRHYRHRDMHPQCFRSVYAKERPFECKPVVAFLDRVVNLL